MTYSTRAGRMAARNRRRSVAWREKRESSYVDQLAWGVTNAINGMGYGATDDSIYDDYRIAPVVLEQEARAWSTSCGVARRISEIIPRDALAPGWSIQGAGDEDAALTQEIKAAQAQIKWGAQGRHGAGLEVALLIGEVLARQFGGALVVGGFDDGAEISAPLPEGGASLMWVRVYTCWESFAIQADGDPSSARYGQPELYQITPRAVHYLQEAPYTVHATRCIAIQGVCTDAQVLATNRGWGDSIYRAYRAPLMEYVKAQQQLSRLLKEQGIASYGMQGYASLKAGPDSGLIEDRMREVTRAKSAYRSLVHDADKEKIGFLHASLSGVGDVFDRKCVYLSDATGIPQVRLFGYSPAGFSTDDAAGTRNYHDILNAYRLDVQTPNLTQAAIWGAWSCGVELPNGWYVEQSPLGAPTRTEAAELDESASRVVKALVDAGVPVAQAVAIYEDRKSFARLLANGAPLV